MPLLALALGAVVFYWPVLSGAGIIWNDFVEQYFPYRVFAAATLRRGEFPFWNPYVFCGMPFFADVQAAVLYPFNALLTLCASPNGLSAWLVEYQIVAHVCAAGICMYLFCRDLGCGRGPAVFAGLAYMLGSFATTHIFHVTMIHTLPWLPLSALLVRRTLERGSLLYAALSAVSLALAAFAGHPQLLLYLHYWLGAWLVFHCVERIRQGATYRSLARPIVLFACAVVLGAGMFAVQLLPAGQLGAASERPEMAYERSCEASLRPYRWVTLLAPNYYGTANNCHQKDSGPYWGMSARDIEAGRHYYWETAIYVGVPTLVLAVVAMAVARTPLSVFFAVMSLLSLLLATGNTFPLYRLAYHLLPGLSRFRIPGRFACLFVMSAAPLAALCLEKLRQDPDQIPERVRRGVGVALWGVSGAAALWALFAMGGALKGSTVSFLLNAGMFGADEQQLRGAVDQSLYAGVLGAVALSAGLLIVSSAAIALRLRGTLRPAALSVGLPVLLFVDLMACGAGYACVRGSPRHIFPRSSLIRQLQAQGATELFRVNMRDSKPGTDDAGGHNMVFQKNEGSVHRLFLMEGYNPLRLRRKFLNRKPQTLDILNVKYVVNVDPSTGRVDPRYPLREYPGAMPRAWMAYRWEVVRDTTEQGMFARLYAPDFDHRTTVALEEPPAVDSATIDSTAAGSVHIARYRMNRIDMDVVTNAPGLLVLSEMHYPAWRATVDGVEAAVLRADYALRAIAVPAGTHRVVCTYRSRAFARGALLSLVCMAATACLAVWGWKHRAAAVPPNNASAHANSA